MKNDKLLYQQLLVACPVNSCDISFGMVILGESFADSQTPERIEQKDERNSKQSFYFKRQIMIEEEEIFIHIPLNEEELNFQYSTKPLSFSELKIYNDPIHYPLYKTVEDETND